MARRWANFWPKLKQHAEGGKVKKKGYGISNWAEAAKPIYEKKIK